MKILSTQQIREADAYTILHEPISSIDLMERAAKACYKWIKKHICKSQTIHIFCGMGNNGGDGLVIARLLSLKGFNVKVYIVLHSAKYSQDFSINQKRLEDLVITHIEELSELSDLPITEKQDVIIDAIFGSGLSKPVEGFAASIISHINTSPAIRISIDIPSGLFADLNNAENTGAKVCADYTLTFQLPKLAFFLAENDVYFGNWMVLDIGLSEEYISQANTHYHFATLPDIKSMIKPRIKFSHKGHYGHALLLAGSKGKTGAAVLASKACLRAGCGLLTTHIPQSSYTIMQTAVPEVMTSIDENNDFISHLPSLDNYNAVGIGPGIDTHNQTQQVLKLLIQNASRPIVIDADAINILSENKTWLSFLPKNSILTPHPKEFERLTHRTSSGFERLENAREFSMKYGVYVILKGAHTAIACPEGNIFFNSTGNPGMATAGSGDVLTGIILGLLAQQYTPLQACLIGVYLHGLAADIVAESGSQQSLIASDITESLKYAFRIICDIK